MAGKYQSKSRSKKGPIKATTSREGLTQGQEIDLEAIERHERLTGINRAMWDIELANQVKAHLLIIEARNFDA